MHMGNWTSTQAGEMLAVYLCRPACGHASTEFNAWGGTTVGTKACLCKADSSCPAGVSVREALLLAQRRFAAENNYHNRRSDRQRAMDDRSEMERDEKNARCRANVYIRFVHTGGRACPCLPRLSVREVSPLLSMSLWVHLRTRRPWIPSTSQKCKMTGDQGWSQR